MKAVELRIYDWAGPIINVLGPGRRAVIWVQGCTLQCPNCMSKEMWPRNGGENKDVSGLLTEILGLHPELEGITVSGGEPSLQAAAVGELFAQSQACGLNTFLYSGYTLEELQGFPDESVAGLLQHTDMLVDGRFDETAMGEYLWRGSGNQRLINLSGAINLDAYKCLRGKLEFRVKADGSFIVIGVPPKGFMHEFRKKMQDKGLQIQMDYMTEE